MNKEVEKIIRKNKHRSKFYQFYKKNNKRRINRSSEKKHQTDRLISFTNKVLLSVILLFVLLISRDSSKLSFIYERTFRHMNFVQIKSFVDTKLNGLFPKTDDPYKYVGSIILDINDTESYREGVLIETDYLEPVLSCVKGIVIWIYHDDELGKVIVIQDIMGREYHYGYLESIEVNLYHHVEYGDILGLGRINEEMNGEYYLAIKDGTDNLDVIQVVNNEN